MKNHRVSENALSTYLGTWNSFRKFYR